MGFQADVRAAAVALLTEYAAGDPGHPTSRLQVYPARPRTINPPTGFIDGINERITYTGQLRQRTPVVEVIVVHGLFDSKEAAIQKDAFVDGLLDWTYARIHEAGANTTVGITETEDLPAYVPDWLPPSEQRTYYATRIALEGYAGG